MWDPRDQPLQGSFPKKDPGYEVASRHDFIRKLQISKSFVLINDSYFFYLPRLQCNVRDFVSISNTLIITIDTKQLVQTA
jgi:hypothetical protein